MDQIIENVRVEVHLFNGAELGPTEAVNLAAGEKRDVSLSAAGQTFAWWKAHDESGIGKEHAGENDEEHEREEHKEHEHGESHEHGEH